MEINAGSEDSLSVENTVITERPTNSRNVVMLRCSSSISEHHQAVHDIKFFGHPADFISCVDAPVTQVLVAVFVVVMLEKVGDGAAQRLPRQRR